jgi:hypothetical protein
MATISERAIALRESRHRERRQGAQVERAVETRAPSRDPWHYAGPPGSWGRPGLDQGPRKAPDGLFERAVEAYGSLTRPDTRFINLARRFSHFMRW